MSYHAISSARAGRRRSPSPAWARASVGTPARLPSESAAVLGHFWYFWPHSTSSLLLNNFLGLFVLTVLANVCYSAAYVADVFVQLSGYRARAVPPSFRTVQAGTSGRGRRPQQTQAAGHRASSLRSTCPGRSATGTQGPRLYPLRSWRCIEAASVEASNGCDAEVQSSDLSLRSDLIAPSHALQLAKRSSPARHVHRMLVL
jgi:hypothetical protein